MAPVTVRVAAPRRRTTRGPPHMSMMLRRHRAKRAGRQTTSAHTTVDVDSLKGKELAAALEAAGLPKTGTADEKRAALAAHYAGTAPAQDEPTEPTEDADEPEGDEPAEPADDEPADDEPADESDES